MVHGRSSLVESFDWLIPSLHGEKEREEREKREERKTGEKKMKGERKDKEKEKKEKDGDEGENRLQFQPGPFGEFISSYSYSRASAR